jgi:hypothetical protein
MKDSQDSATIDMLKRGRGRPASGVSKAEQNRRNVQRAREKRVRDLRAAELYLQNAVDYGIKDGQTNESLFTGALRALLLMRGVQLLDMSDEEEAAKHSDYIASRKGQKIYGPGEHII